MGGRHQRLLFPHAPDGTDCYAPLQTLSDFMLSYNYVNAFYNGETVVFALYGTLGSADELTELGEIVHSVERRERSRAMADYSYAELCLALDSLYGLKDSHSFTDFDSLFDQTGLFMGLKSTDPAEADEALYRLITLHLDDLHSNFTMPSPLNDPALLHEFREQSGEGQAEALFVRQYIRYLTARHAARPDGIPAYEEVGNTAYITFDQFEGIPDSVDYYEIAPTAEAEDTIGIMLYAYSQIMREGSPVENVVLDLSCNTGGDADTAVFTISAFLGEGYVSILDTLSGGMATGNYEIDINLDGQFDDGDLGLLDKKLFCLTSPVSFSCGNLVPNVFKNSNMVTLLGRTSGGGSCLVLPMSTADGTAFQISGFLRLAFPKNGSFYDIDQGAAPDFTLSDPASYYDREALTEYINNLM